MGAVWNLSETIRRLEYAREPQREVTRSRVTQDYLACRKFNIAQQADLFEI